MTMPEEIQKPFKFTTQRQNKIYTSLKRFIVEAPASFYKDACKIMDENSTLETKTNLVGHLLREIYGWILGYMLPSVGYTEPTGENRRVQKIKDAAKLYEIDEDSNFFQKWKMTTKDLHKKAHRDSMGEVQPVDELFIKIWNNSEEVFAFLLDKIESNYLNYTKQLDYFLSKKITSDDLSKIKVHIPLNQITLSYFFEKLDDPDCLKPLHKKGFFEFPKKPILHEDGGTSYPFWPPMIYLVKLSKIPKAQDDILAICLEIETENIQIQVPMLDIALNLPADKSIPLVKKSYNWFTQMKSWFHAEKYGKLFLHLAQAGYKKEALDLANKILEVKPNPRKPYEVEGHSFPHDPVALMDEYHYEKILEKDFSNLVDLIGLDAIKILLDQIENYINLSDVNRKKGSKDDYSEIWRQAIEESSNNYGESIRDLLIDGARNNLESFLKKYPSQIDTVITELDTRKLNIFKRLSLHLLRVFPENAEKLITDKLMDKNEFKDTSHRLTHEYFLLAEAHSSLLNKSQLKEIWSWIMSGADTTKYIKWRKKNYGVDTPNELVKRYVKDWQMYHLVPFKDINPEWQKYFEQLVADVGQPEHPSFKSWSTGGSFGPNSIVSEEQLKKMDPKDVATYLAKWEPDENDPLNRSREGTGRTLTAQITEDPSKWTANLSLFSELDPTYVKSIMYGFRDSIRQSKKFDWAPLLELCKNVLKKPIKIKGKRASTPFGDDPDWNWCRNTIVELLSEGLKEVTGQIPYSLKDEVWAIIEPLTHDSNPTPEFEAKYLASDHDPVSLAINTTRGDALDAAMQYGVWLKNSYPTDKQAKWNFSVNSPELLQVLNERLDISTDPSVGIRALYGEKLGLLAWLDQGWVEANEDLIFPKDPNLQKYFNAAWDAYITYVHPFNNLYKIIKRQYERAITELGKHTDQKHHSDNPEQLLAQHLIVYYWRGLIDLESGPLADFYAIASVELKSEIIDFIGRVCKKDKEVPQKVKDRLAFFLEWRIKELKKKNASEDDVKELQSLSWWVSSEKFEDSWILEKLYQSLEMGCDIEGDHLAMERFVTIADQYPLEVIRCSRLIIENDKKGWGILHWQDELKLIIETVLKSENINAKKEAVEFIHRLAARGRLEFKELLQ